MAMAVSEMYEYGGFWSQDSLDGRGIVSAAYLYYLTNGCALHLVTSSVVVYPSASHYSLLLLSILINRSSLLYFTAVH